jgi:tRNA A-37 threonylcarbamoyl transferase component Bud32
MDVDSLVARWLEAREQGRPLSTDELCRDWPHLKADLDRALAPFLAFGSILPGGTQPATPPASQSVVSLPGYEILGELGRGGMGVVYKARDLKLKRVVALKMILSGSHAGETERERFQTEARAIARLQHPNVVQVFEVGECEGRPFFVMEYCAGGSLEKCLAGVPLPPAKAAALVASLGLAMQAAHDHGVVHRDLKPGNVLLTTDGTPKVTDFGLARNAELTLTQPGVVVGSPPYMSPEQAEGRAAEVGPLADVYALGATLYECLTGRPPFRGQTLHDTVSQVIAAEPVPPSRLNPHCPRDLETICLKCLAKEPRRRYESAEALADDLQAFLDGKPIKARAVGRAERAWKWSNRNRTLAALFVLSVLAPLAVTGVSISAAWMLYVQKEELRSTVMKLDAATDDLGDRNAKLKKALAAKDDALREKEKQRQNALVQTRERLLESANAALKRGELTFAERQFDQAHAIGVEADPAGQRQIEVDRLRTLPAYGRWDRLRQELGRLGALEELTPRQRAEVLMHQGDLDLWEDPAEARKGKDRLRAALAIKDGLRPADAAYVRGVLADGSLSAAASFQEAVGHERYHLRANAALLMELALSGLHGGARAHAIFMARAFPSEPVVPLALALMATLEGESATEHLKEVKRLVKDQRQMKGLLGALLVIEKAIRGEAPEVVPLPKGKGGGIGEFRVVGVGLPLLHRRQQLFDEMEFIKKRLEAGDVHLARPLLAHALSRWPERLLRLQQAMLHQNRVFSNAANKKGRDTTEDQVSAYEWFREAIDCPTVLPTGSQRRDAAWMVYALDAYAEGAARQSWLSAAVAAVGGQPLLALASLTSAAKREESRAIRRRGDQALRVLLEPCPRRDGAREALLPDLLTTIDVDEARRLLARWCEDEKANARPYLLLIELERARGDTRRAAEWAARGLTALPGNRALLDSEQKVRSQPRAAPKGVTSPRPAPTGRETGRGDPPRPRGLCPPSGG